MTVKKITKKYTVTSKSAGGYDLGANIASNSGYDVGANQPIQKKDKKDKEKKDTVASKTGLLTKAQKKAGLTYDSSLTKGQKNKLSQAKYLKSIKKGKKKKRSARRKLRKASLGM